MNWFSHPCTRHRQNLCLLASGVLSASEREVVERHLSVCPNCQTYYAEIQRMTTQLASLPQTKALREPNPSARQRWAQAILAADSPVALPKKREQVLEWPAFRNWCDDVLWPYRRIWAGLAVVWMLMLAAHLSLREASPAPVLATKTVPSAQTMLMAFKDRQNALDELLTTHPAPEAERRKPLMPKPRTENTTVSLT